MKKSELRKIIREEIKTIIKESKPGTFGYYVNHVKDELDRLESGYTIIQVINGDFTGKAAKYRNSTWKDIKSGYIMNNFKKGIPAVKTAQYLRDKWYGV